jgi:dihydrolipoamide dehydrogenase
MNAHKTKLLVIGGGPGGYVAAIRAAQLGIPTTLVEAAALGGTCLNIGCIPSKALIHAAEEFDKIRQCADKGVLGIRVDAPKIDVAQTVRWKDGIVAKLTGGVATLLKKHGVEVVHGWATIVDGKTVEVRVAGAGPEDDVLRIGCEHMLLATGSHTIELPILPFGEVCVSATEALSPPSLPKHLIVVGAGYIGLELGIAYRKLGAEVTVVESASHILPVYDEELTRPVVKSLQRLGVKLHLNCTVLGLSASGQGVRVRQATGEGLELSADRVLVAVGRFPAAAGWGLEKLMLDMQGHAVKVDDQCRTSMRGVWAIGDLTGEPMLAHRAMAQGEMVAEIIAGQRRHFMPMAIPAVCFTDPEVVVVGRTPQEAAKAGVDHIHGLFPFAANGRSLTLESGEGFVRVVARRDNHLILGWQAVGHGVAELTTAFCYSLEMGMRLEDVGGTIHAHPTLGEALQEAALRALGHAIHV